MRGVQGLFAPLQKWQLPQAIAPRSHGHALHPASVCYCQLSVTRRVLLIASASMPAITQKVDDNPQRTHPELSLRPARQTKVVHFIRHAQGFHNIGFEDNADAHLTEFGWKQTETLRTHIRSLTEALNVQVVIVSPLMRTLETASGVFGAASSSDNGAQLLMRSKSALPNERSQHDDIVNDLGIPIIACEQCRERMGSNRCDMRRPLHETKAAFPGVDFSLISTEDDVLWEELHAQVQTRGVYRIGEGEDVLARRGCEFLHWLMTRPETHIAVVSHAGFIRHTLASFASPDAPELNEELNAEFENCEMRTMVLADSKAIATPDPTYFPGGWAAAGQ